MKVLLINGSPHKNGCSYTALSEVAKTLESEGVETEIFQLGANQISGCIACGYCKKNGKCVFNDCVNEFSEKARSADGFIFASPVYYASANGSFISFMDRLFYSSGGAERNPFYLKPAAAVVSARRAGTTATIDEINKYFLIKEMPIISSQYWNMVHGNTPEDVKRDEEGLQIMRTLGRNMAWFLKIKEAGEKAGVKPPEREKGISTNFVS